MSEAHAPPSLPSRNRDPVTVAPLYKQKSWSPDAERDEAWLRRKGNWKNRRSKSVTDEDVDELKACIELGFGFDSSPEVEQDRRLSDALPALGLYYAVNKSYDSLLSKSTTNTTPSDCDSTPSPLSSPQSATSIFSHDGEDKAEAVGSGCCLCGAAKFMVIFTLILMLVMING